MNSITLPLQADGPLVAIQIGFPAPQIQAMRKQGLAIPAPIQVFALIDSGAEASFIDTTAFAPIRFAGLVHRRIVITNIPALGGVNAAMEYAVGLRILHPSNDPKRDLVVGRHDIFEQSLGALGYQALIGRDILSRCMFILDGPSNSFTLAY